uniref:SGNH hydrolase-type esterase domain-containing protein n=1 Tax=Salix viminalis TaxID=40686 RepID=A0A6N2KCZ9_SALVM
MASQIISSRLLLLALPVLACVFPCSCHARATDNNGARIRGMFVFGSSLVDNGNNNFLKNSIAKADFLPYGIDFPSGPSGRFTNGKNVIDLLCDQLKLPLVPAFSHPSTQGRKIIHGVNYASGASGILDDTGSRAGNAISLNQQLRNFEEVTLPDLEAQMGFRRRELLPEFLFVVGTGGNDYSFNYFLRQSTANASLEVFTANLTKILSGRLQPDGDGQPTRTPWMHSSVEQGSSPLQCSLEVLGRYTTSSCCEVMALNRGGNGVLCKKEGKACEDRNSHVFFDGLHPTEAVNIQIATKAYNSNLTSEVYPINVKQLSMF